MGLIVLVIFIILSMLLISAIIQWIKTMVFYAKNKTLITDINKDVAKLIEKATDIDFLIDAHQKLVEQKIAYISDKYKTYDYAILNENRNKELRRYFAQKSKRK